MILITSIEGAKELLVHIDGIHLCHPIQDKNRFGFDFEATFELGCVDNVVGNFKFSI